MIRRFASIGITAAAVIALGAAPAHAEDEIGLSRDGVTWTPELTAPLFAPDFRFVPGDVEVRSFRVRNDGPSAGVLTVDVIATDPDALLLSDDFTIEARVASGPWIDVDEGTNRVVTQIKVPEDAQSQVEIRATFDWDSTVQLLEVPFRVRLTLSEDGDVAGEEEGNGNGNGGEVGGEEDSLPDTGSPVGAGTIWLAAALIGAGLALVRPRRERGEAVIRHG